MAFAVFCASAFLGALATLESEVRMPGEGGPAPQECVDRRLGSALPPAASARPWGTLAPEPARLQDRGTHSLCILLYFVVRVHFAITNQVAIKFSGCLLKYLQVKCYHFGICFKVSPTKRGGKMERRGETRLHKVKRC